MTDVVTGEAVVLDVRPARLPSRIVALFLDALLQALLMFGIIMLTLRIGSVADQALIRAVGITGFVLVTIGYSTVLESLWRGRTPGKAALGLRVVGDDGGPERFRQALLRALTRFVESWFALMAFVLVGMGAAPAWLLLAVLGPPASFLLALFSRNGKRLGDIFAGTMLVRERLPAQGGPMAAMPPQLASWAFGLELSGLSDEAALTARQFLSRYHQLNPHSREQMGVRIASAVAAQIRPAPPAGTPPVAFLSAVLAERRRREATRLDSPQPYVTAAPGAYPQAPPPGEPPGPAWDGGGQQDASNPPEDPWSVPAEAPGVAGRHGVDSSSESSRDAREEAERAAEEPAGGPSGRDRPSTPPGGFVPPA